MSESRSETLVVLVNHHSEALLQGKAAALLSAGFSLTVVDNSASYTGPGRVIAAGRNVGFGSACNLAVASAPAAIRRICLHNPDVSASPAMVDKLCAGLALQKCPGAVAPAVRAGGRLRERGYRYPSPWREAAIALLAANGTKDPSHATPIRAAGIGGRRFGTGALMVVDRCAWERIDGFDERYFLYVEDLDLWERLSRAGHDTGFEAGAVVEHHGGTGSPLHRAPREILRRLGIEYFAERHQGGWRAYRLVHRPFLRSLSGRAPVLAEAVSRAWSRQCRPSEVLDLLRPGLESGELLRAAW